MDFISFIFSILELSTETLFAWKCKNSTSERSSPPVCTVVLGRPRLGIGNRHTFLISFQLLQRKSNGRYRLSHIFLRGCKIGLQCKMTLFESFQTYSNTKVSLHVDFAGFWTIMKLMSVKVQLFLKGHKNLKESPIRFDAIELKQL